MIRTSPSLPIDIAAARLARGCSAASAGAPARAADTTWRFRSRPSALELLDLVLELLRGGSERRREIAPCRGSMEEVLAARVQGHLHLMP